jgi:hypothetical protein
MLLGIIYMTEYQSHFWGGNKMAGKKYLVNLLAFLIMLPIGIAYAGQSGGVASGTGPALPGGIQASINPEGLGDSLLYGYYNVRGNVDLFNVVNTDMKNGAKARVVFREGKNGTSCLEFSMCLKAGDVWTGYLIDDGTTAALCPVDSETLTSPMISGSCMPFRYEGAGGLAGVKADDCREGYFEVVGMMNIPDYKTWNASPLLKTETDCRDYSAGADLGNVLMGDNSIVKLSDLETYSYDATAIADTRLAPLSTTTDIDAGGFPLVMDKGCPEADYIFMKSNIISPFNVMPEIGGETEIIVTFPTRLACHADPASPDKQRVPQPFPQFDSFNPYNPDPNNDILCAYNTPFVWDGIGDLILTCELPMIGPQPLPNVVNVMRMGLSNIWDSTVAFSIATADFELGWINVDFENSCGPLDNHSMTYGSNPSRTVSGLPAIAYTTQSFASGAASYMKPARYETNIQ